VSVQSVQDIFLQIGKITEDKENQEKK